MIKSNQREEKYTFEGEFVMLHKTFYRRDHTKQLNYFDVFLSWSNSEYTYAAQS